MEKNKKKSNFFDELQIPDSVELQYAWWMCNRMCNTSSHKKTIHHDWFHMIVFQIVQVYQRLQIKIHEKYNFHNKIECFL